MMALITSDCPLIDMMALITSGCGQSGLPAVLATPAGAEPAAGWPVVLVLQGGLDPAGGGRTTHDPLLVVQFIFRHLVFTVDSKQILGSFRRRRRRRLGRWAGLAGRDGGECAQQRCAFSADRCAVPIARCFSAVSLTTRCCDRSCCWPKRGRRCSR